MALLDTRRRKSTIALASAIPEIPKPRERDDRRKPAFEDLLSEASLGTFLVVMLQW